MQIKIYIGVFIGFWLSSRATLSAKGFLNHRTYLSCWTIFTLALKCNNPESNGLHTSWVLVKI